MFVEIILGIATINVQFLLIGVGIKTITIKRGSYKTGVLQVKTLCFNIQSVLTCVNKIA
jgi:hypothetical protein